MTRSHNKHVLVIGGGLAGVCVATTLAKTTAKTGLRITILEPKDFVEIHWAAIRAMFDTATAESALIPLAPGLQAYPTITHIRAKVLSMTAESVTLDDGQVLRFDACLVATGSFPAFEPLRATTNDRDARLAELAASGTALKETPSALVIGGGLIGSEIAGDIAAYSEAEAQPTKVTLVHSRELLAAPLKEPGATSVREKLEALGVEVVTGQHAEKTEDGWATKESGESLSGETVVQAVGVTPTGGGELVRDAVSTSGVDERGWILTDKFGRVEGGGGAVFAYGDCVKGEFKSGVNIMGGKEAVAANIQAVVEARHDGRPVAEAEEAMKEIPAPVEYVSVTAGPRAGVMQTPWFTDTRIIPMIKNKTMFISRGKSQMSI